MRLILEIVVDDKNLFTIPDTNTHVLAPIDELAFFDSQTVHLSKSISPLDAWNLVMSRPMPVLKAAFILRDIISTCFGVKKIGGFSGRRPGHVKLGEKLDFFTVEHISDDVLSLSERDRHLDVLTCISRVGNELTITSSVKIHNIFGRIYMVPVSPAHKLIVRNFLRYIQRHLEGSKTP